MPPTESDAGDAALAREQGAEASALWAAGDFDAAHQTLQRLEATLPTDARVRKGAASSTWWLCPALIDAQTHVCCRGDVCVHVHRSNSTSGWQDTTRTQAAALTQ